MCHCYPEETANFPESIKSLLWQHGTMLHPEVRMSLCRSLIIMRNKDFVQALRYDFQHNICNREYTSIPKALSKIPKCLLGMRNRMKCQFFHSFLVVSGPIKYVVLAMTGAVKYQYSLKSGYSQQFMKNFNKILVTQQC